MARLPDDDNEVLLAKSALPTSGALKFCFQAAGWELEGLVVRAEEQLHVYINRCAHLPVTLDFDDGDLMTDDGTELRCQSHGARYTPSTGECVWGPCKGKSLERLSFVEDADGNLRVDVSQVDSDRPPPPQRAGQRSRRRGES